MAAHIELRAIPLSWAVSATINYGPQLRPLVSLEGRLYRHLLIDPVNASTVQISISAWLKYIFKCQETRPSKGKFRIWVSSMMVDGSRCLALGSMTCIGNLVLGPRALTSLIDPLALTYCHIYLGYHIVTICMLSVSYCYVLWLILLNCELCSLRLHFPHVLRSRQCMVGREC